MTVRAIVIGCLLALAVATFGYANDWLFGLPYVASDLIPVSVFGLLTLALLLANPALRWLGGRHYSVGEVAVMFSLMLVACVIPGPGLLWHFHSTLVAPISLQEVNPGWKATEEHPALLSYVPPTMLANDGVFDEKVVKGFMQGLGRGGRALDPSAVPWGAWMRPYAFYLPLLAIGFLAIVCLTMIVHRQWAYREHLPYPVAEVANELIRQDPAMRFNPIFHDHFFWIGFGISSGVLLVNGLATYHPGYVRIPMEIDMTALAQIWPKLSQVSRYWGQGPFFPRFFFAAIGLAYLLSGEVSFSIGISNWVYGLVFLAATAHGVDMSWDYMAGGVMPYMVFGAYVGGGLAVLYTGRKFYHAVLRRSLGLRSGERVEGAVVWAGRILLVSAAVMVLTLRLVLDLDVTMCVLMLAMVALMFLMVTRINAETGLLFVQPTWHAVGILAGLFGVRALGPRTLIILGMMSLVLTVDPRVCLMPLAANALKVSDRQAVPTGRLGRWVVGVLAVCLVVAVPFTLYVQYTYGVNRLYGWASEAAAMPFDMLSRNVNALAQEYALDSAGQADGWGGLQRLTVMDPSRTFLWSCLLGLGLMLACSAARLRWSWWPIHPVLFLVWGTIISGWFAPSFLAGWAVKVGVTRFGGNRAYLRVRPMFIGMVAGEMVMGIVWMIVGGAYYAVFGTPGPMFHVHP